MQPSRLLAHDASNEKQATLTERIWEIFGFGTQYAWILCVIFGIPAFKLSGSVAEIGRVKFIFIVGFALAYLILFCLRKVPVVALPGRLAIISAGTAGTLATIIVALPISEPIGAIIFAAILAGFSSAILMTAGNKTWSKLRSERVMMHLTTSALVASILYFVLLILPSLVSLIIVSALPITGSIILAFTKKNKPRPTSFRRVDPTEKYSTIRILSFVASFSFAMGVMLGTVNEAQDITDLLWVSTITMTGVLAASAFAFFCAARRAPSTMLTYLDRAGTPLMLIGCVSVLALPENLMAFGFACIIAGFVLCDLFMWFLNAEMVSRSGRSPFEVLARSCLVEWSAIACGFAIVGGVSIFFIPQGGIADYRWLFALCAIILILVNQFIFTPVHAIHLIEARVGSQGEERLHDACAVIAEQSGLSQRESEVMIFLANGRTVPYIQEKLTLSQSTVKTHVRAIYRKLNIDSKQALIDLVEEVIERQA